MDKRPVPYFEALGDIAAKLAEFHAGDITWDDSSPLLLEMLLLSAALYIRKLDEHGFLKPELSPARKKYQLADGKNHGVGALINNIIHSRSIDTSLKAVETEIHVVGGHGAEYVFNVLTFSDIVADYAKGQKA